MPDFPFDPAILNATNMAAIYVGYAYLIATVLGNALPPGNAFAEFFKRLALSLRGHQNAAPKCKDTDANG